MSENRYGVDINYFYKLFDRELTDLNDHTPSELARVLARASITADKDVVLEEEFSGQLRTKNTAQAQEILELRLHVNDLRDAIEAYNIEQINLYGDEPVDLLNAYEKTPAQSLQAHNAAIEDEVIERSMAIFLDAIKRMSPMLALEEVINQQRKYKEQDQ